MSSATPMVSSVLDVLLKTSAPSTSRDQTKLLASPPVATTTARTPLRSRAAAAEAMRSSEASSEKSESRCRADTSNAAGSSTARLGETAMHQRHRHGPLADRRRAPLDRPVPDIARGEEARQVGLQRERLAPQRPAVGRPS